jgi:GDP-4-dehydro-6-deoxy-D-mannose reductase
MNNVVGQLNLLDPLRQVSPDARVLVACSSEQYGLVRQEDIPIDEDTPFRPNNPYAVSKIAQDALALQYFLTYGQKTIRVRAFNHIGPGQQDHFVASAFARQVARIEAGLQEPVLYVGNLEAERDFTDVRDMVRAHRLALLAGTPGEVYNLGRGTAIRIGDALDDLVAMCRVPVRVVVDADLLRPFDVPRQQADTTKFRALTGWQPEIPWQTTLRETLDHWRARVGAPSRIA